MKRKSVSPEFLMLRVAIKRVLSDPMIKARLPPGIQQDIAPALALDASKWLPDHDKAMQHAMKWAMGNL